jgi:hypothetical protein
MACCSENISKNIQMRALSQKTSKERNSQTSEFQRFHNCYEEISLLEFNSNTNPKTITETTAITEEIELDDDIIDHITRRLYEHESFVAFSQVILAGSYFAQGDIGSCLQHLILVLSLSLSQFILFSETIAMDCLC